MRYIFLFQRGDLFRRQIKRQRCYRIMKMIGLRGANDRCGDPGLLQHPGERHLRTRNAAFVGDIRNYRRDLAIGIGSCGLVVEALAGFVARGPLGDIIRGARQATARERAPRKHADAFSHNALCTLFNRFGISALRLSKPYHDIRRPAELERSDYAVSANIGRTISACRQAVVDIRSCLDWLESQGYEQFGVLGTSLGSCYAFIAAAHDPRLQVCAFNHASTWFGDVAWTGQSTRHVRAAFEQASLTQDLVREIFAGVSPMSYMDRFAAEPKRVLVVHATYDLTFLRKFSLEVLANFDRLKVDYVSKVLPCGHYTTGETPYKYIDGWYLGSFIYKSFKHLAEQASPKD